MLIMPYSSTAAFLITPRSFLTSRSFSSDVISASSAASFASGCRYRVRAFLYHYAQRNWESEHKREKKHQSNGSERKSTEPSALYRRDLLAREPSFDSSVTVRLG